MPWLSDTANMFSHTCTFVGNMVQPLSPPTIAGGGEPQLHFDWMALADVANDLWDQHGSTFRTRGTLFPKVPTEFLPVSHDGTPLVVSEGETQRLDDDGKVACPICDQRVLRNAMRAHMGSHILAKVGLTHTASTCGFCGGDCTYTATGRQNSPSFCCSYKYMYKKASVTNANSSCRNVLVKCPHCATTNRATGNNAAILFWAYNLYEHYQQEHSSAPFPEERGVNEEEELTRMVRAGVACAAAVELHQGRGNGSV
eukprot:GHVU01210857.1.p1 GENE.GHVU01210857.1~~GHVU01210857.1.p1  ORF type:complete len:256 (+),score=25.01 GHVU01210857.1:1357-2124(+)